MKKLKTKLSLLFFLFCYASFAQGEFVVEINRVTGAYAKVGPQIPNLSWVMTDESGYIGNQGIYLITGIGSSLYSVSVDNGATLYNCSAPNTMGFEFDNTNNTMYAIKWGTTNKSLIALDYTTGTTTYLGSPFSNENVNQGDYYAYDQNNHRYIFFDYSGRLYSINTSTGAVISNPTLNSPPGFGIRNMSFDNSTGTLYAIMRNESTQKTILATINPANGNVTTLGQETSNGLPNGTGTIDEANQYYIYCYGFGPAILIVTLNLIDGSLVSSVLMDYEDVNDNFYGLEFDNNLGKLYAMHWDNEIILSNTSQQSQQFKGIYPNPISDYGLLEIPQSYSSELKLSIYNSLGTLVRTQENINASTIRIDKEDLSQGIYFYNLMHQGKSINNGKFIIK
ncbi:T9SS type A sorting domain-containing protein [Flavobacterium terrisoli]|uniref:T9SS type A sorting domain-containing protein n=1 Tax=Flavobacterium terrisoli TaxID=3242195 RepID=UPI0025432037|nr:T9SS type A sorting domain-containing protein [Flavobacterium buctense]